MRAWLKDFGRDFALRFDYHAEHELVARQTLEQWVQTPSTGGLLWPGDGDFALRYHQRHFDQTPLAPPLPFLQLYAFYVHVSFQWMEFHRYLLLCLSSCWPGQLSMLSHLQFGRKYIVHINKTFGKPDIPKLELPMHLNLAIIR
jgi:hypothetical protein